MITGIITDEREISIRLEALAADGSPFSFDAALDTGFNGFLTLPGDALNALEASPAGTRRAELGDGHIIEMDVYFVTVKWHSEKREVLALHSDAKPLIGMSLLWGSRVEFDAKDGGIVTVTANR